VSFHHFRAGPWVRAKVLLNEVGDGLGIDQAVRMMAGAFFDHDADPAAALMIDVLDDLRVFLQDKIVGPADVEQRTSCLISPAIIGMSSV